MSVPGVFAYVHQNDGVHVVAKRCQRKASVTSSRSVLWPFFSYQEKFTKLKLKIISG